MFEGLNTFNELDGWLRDQEVAGSNPVSPTRFTTIGALEGETPPPAGTGGGASGNPWRDHHGSILFRGLPCKPSGFASRRTPGSPPSWWRASRSKSPRQRPRRQAREEARGGSAPEGVGRPRHSIENESSAEAVPSWATVKHAAFLKHSRGEHVAETADWYPVKVEAILSRSFPGPGGADAFWEMVAADIGGDRIGIAATRDGGLGFSFPVVIVSGVK